MRQAEQVSLRHPANADRTKTQGSLPLIWCPVGVTLPPPPRQHWVSLPHHQMLAHGHSITPPNPNNAVPVTRPPQQSWASLQPHRHCVAHLDNNKQVSCPVSVTPLPMPQHFQASLLPCPLHPPGIVHTKKARRVSFPPPLHLTGVRMFDCWVARHSALQMERNGHQ
jgi:hypothetical protein